MNFITFMKNQEHRKDTVGQFARLVSYRDDLHPPIHSSYRHKWETWLTENGANKELVNKLYRLIRINEFKRRQAAPGLRVSQKAFGAGRRVPIVNQYQGKIK